MKKLLITLFLFILTSTFVSAGLYDVSHVRQSLSMDDANVSGIKLLDDSNFAEDGQNDGATTGVAGAIEEAINFDGSNDYIDLGIPYEVAQNSYAVAFWIRFDTIAALDYIFTDYETNPSNNKIQMYVDDIVMEKSFVYKTKDVANSFYYFQPNNGSELVVNNMYHVIVNFDTAGNTCTAYVDGLVATTMAGSTGCASGSHSSAQNWTLGLDSPGGTLPLDGTIDQWMVFDEVLNASMISALSSGLNIFHENRVASINSTINITTPLPFRSYASNSTNETLITINGTFTGSVTNVDARFNLGAWATLDSSPMGGLFNGSLRASTGTGDIEVRFNNNVTINDSVSNITVLAFVPPPDTTTGNETTTTSTQTQDSFYLILIGLLFMVVGWILRNAIFFFAGGTWFVAVSTAAVFTGVSYLNAVFYLLVGLACIYHGVDFIITNRKEERRENLGI